MIRNTLSLPAFGRFLGLLGMVALAACDQAGQQAQKTEPAEPVLPTFSADAIKGHVTFLADDLLEGRDAGTRGYDIAASYVASQFLTMGLDPAGTDGYLQPVSLREVELVEDAALLAISGPDGNTTLEFGSDYLMGGRASFDKSTVSAPIVFAGFGIEAPGRGHNDYADLDVEGKIVAVISGGPKDWPSEERAYFSSGATKAATATRHGALGLLTINSRTDLDRRPWERRVQMAGGKAMTWVGPDGKGHSSAPLLEGAATLSPDAAALLFAGAPADLESVLEAAETGAPEPMALATQATLSQKSLYTDVTSPNVAGLLKGSDPALADEVVVLTAHLDHVGTGPEIDGDDLYNGAMDNAAGIATMLEVARVMTAADEAPARSILFLAVTAEEKGLLGAEYFANNPTVPGEKIVANVNLDMPILLYDFVDVIAFGADHSSLGPLVAEAVARADVSLIPDPMPEENIFVRSDHYRFVQQGIPSVFLATGWGTTPDGVDGGEQFRTFLATHYHKPSDDLDLPFDWDAAAKFALVNWLIASEIADADTAPTWNEGDFFGDLYAAETMDEPAAPMGGPEPIEEGIDETVEAVEDAVDDVTETAEELAGDEPVDQNN